MRKRKGIRKLVGLIGAAGAVAAVAVSMATAVPSAGASATIKILAESGVGTPIGSYPGDWGGPQAAALAINKAGGINGTKVQVITCNDNISANGAVTCAREAVADKVTAVVGWTGFDPQINPILAAAKIPVIQWVISDFSDALSAKGQWKIQFPLNGGAFPEWIGEVFAAKAAGAKTLAFVPTNFPGIDTVVNQEKGAAMKNGLTDLGSVPTVLTQTDFSSTAQQLAALKPDAVLLNATSPQEDAILQAAAQIGFNPIWVSDGGTFNPQTFAAFAKLAPKIWMSSSVPFANANNYPAIKQLNKEMDVAAAAGIANAAVSNRDESTVFSWLSTHAMAQVAATIKGPITNLTLLAALNKAKNVNVFGMEVYSPAAKGLAHFPRVTSGGLDFIGPVKNGLYVPSSRVAALKLGGV
jgi:ABC-type branched-subunit amino acid transport system substrate-binding protein